MKPRPPRLLSDRQLAEIIREVAAGRDGDDPRDRFSSIVAALTGRLQSKFPAAARALWCDVLQHEPDDDHNAHVDAYWKDRLNLRAVFKGEKP